jgi:hypothetical protein
MILDISVLTRGTANTLRGIPGKNNNKKNSKSTTALRKKTEKKLGKMITVIKNPSALNSNTCTRKRGYIKNIEETL